MTSFQTTHYDRDMPIMRAHAIQSPEGLCDIITFVLCTIQQPLQSVANQIQDVRLNGAQSKFLFGSKRDGYQYAQDHKHVLHAALLAASAHSDALGFVDVISCIPGLGIVKAAFVAQCCGFESSCLDTHNLRKLGLAETAFKLAKSVKPDTKRKKIEQYLKLTLETGGSRYWWLSWCETVAGSRHNRKLPTADAVSAYHAQCIS
jgi:hypothetical protein